LWAKSFGGTGEETVKFAYNDQASGDLKKSSDSTAINLIKSDGWRGIWIFGESNSVQLKIPTNPPTTRPNKDSTGKTTDIYSVKLNETNGDPWMSMMIGGTKNEGFYPNIPLIPSGGPDVSTWVYMESDEVNWDGYEALVVKSSIRYVYKKALTGRESAVVRWRGYSNYDTGTSSSSTAILVEGTIRRLYDYVTQVLYYGNQFSNFVPNGFGMEKEVS
jgi:hypothetical protein